MGMQDLISVIFEEAGLATAEEQAAIDVFNDGLVAGRDGSGTHSARLAAVLQRAPAVPAVYGDPCGGRVNCGLAAAMVSQSYCMGMSSHRDQAWC